MPAGAARRRSPSGMRGGQLEGEVLERRVTPSRFELDSGSQTVYLDDTTVMAYAEGAGELCRRLPGHRACRPGHRRRDHGDPRGGQVAMSVSNRARFVLDAGHHRADPAGPGRPRREAAARARGSETAHLLSRPLRAYRNRTAYPFDALSDCRYSLRRMRRHTRHTMSHLRIDRIVFTRGNHDST